MNKVAIINENWSAGATRCARDLEAHLSLKHTVRYYPRNESETMDSVLRDLELYAPDVVHCHSYYGSFPYRLLRVVSHRYPTCFTPHDTRPMDGAGMHPACYACHGAVTCRRCPLIPDYARFLCLVPFLNRYFLRRLHKRYIHWKTHPALRIVAPSQWLLNRLRTTELGRFKITHIPCGIDLELFRPLPSPRARLDLPPERKIILYVAYTAGWIINPHKGLLTLADAFIKLVVPRYPEALLIVAGGGLIPNHPSIRPVGLIPQSQMPWYYSAADLLAAPSIADNLPYTVLEAMACGTTVVASSVGGIPEEVEDGITGYLVPPADVSALGAAMLRVLSQPHAQRDTMRQASRVRAESIFGMNRFVQRHEQIYQQTAADWNGSRRVAEVDGD